MLDISSLHGEESAHCVPIIALLDLGYKRQGLHDVPDLGLVPSESPAIFRRRFFNRARITG